MTESATALQRPEWLDVEGQERLAARLELALSRARSAGAPVLASTTVAVDGATDPTGVIAASRRPGEHWFCFEQPDRDAAALAALGCARAIEASGPDRFQRIASRWQAISASALADPSVGPPGAGLVAVGGLAFDSDGGSTPPWSGFAAGSLIVPDLSLARRMGDVRLTINICVAPDDTLPDLLASVRLRLGGLRTTPLPLLDPAPTGQYRVSSAMPPSHFEQAVGQAVRLIRAGELEKVVLAREVQVHAPVAHDPAAAVGVLREAFPSCYVFAVGRGDATFVAASPELLVRREGQRASTVALAGSTRRSADPAVDDHLGEQLLRSDKDLEENAIVARRIATSLRPHAVWVTAAPDPALVRVANIQHLARPIRAQLARPLGVIELAAVLHPTPAVGAEPATAATELIPALEGLDRGWYAGPVGWTDATGDGEFCVALRCAVVRGSVAHCYAGCGIVRDSDPVAELEESEVKLQAMLPVLAG